MTPPLLLVHVIMNDMAYCDLCDLDREFCEHSMTERRRNAAAAAGGLLISPANIAPSRTATIKATIRITACGPGSTPHAHGNGEQLPATGGHSPGLIARTRCQDCISHGPW
jgi:hypothetical protein